MSMVLTREQEGCCGALLAWGRTTLKKNQKNPGSFRWRGLFSLAPADLIGRLQIPPRRANAYAFHSLHRGRRNSVRRSSRRAIADRPLAQAQYDQSAAAAEFRAGMSDFQNLSLDAAGSHFKAAIDADPSFGLARVLYANSTTALNGDQFTIEMNRGAADAARATDKERLPCRRLPRSSTRPPDSANALFRTASQLMPADELLAWGAAGAFGAPLATTRDFVTRHPNYAPGYNTLAYQAWAAGDRTGALAAAKRQVELLPTAPNPHDSYAEILQWNGNFADAAAHYKQATTLSPKFPEAYAGLAEVAALQGQYDQARTYLNQAIANA